MLMSRVDMKTPTETAARAHHLCWGPSAAFRSFSTSPRGSCKNVYPDAPRLPNRFALPLSLNGNPTLGTLSRPNGSRPLGPMRCQDLIRTYQIDVRTLWRANTASSTDGGTTAIIRVEPPHIMQKLSSIRWAASALALNSQRACLRSTRPLVGDQCLQVGARIVNQDVLVRQRSCRRHATASWLAQVPPRLNPYRYGWSLAAPQQPLELLRDGKVSGLSAELLETSSKNSPSVNRRSGMPALSTFPVRKPARSKIKRKAVRPPIPEPRTPTLPVPS
jgi:hypothetical protein